jgi:crotonobetainyl-CoA:carnitine CoA-transferase CaiB-like acyl-CoA transferase
MCGTHLVQGILAALIARAKTGKGALLEVNLLSSLIDFQFEVITTHLNDGGKLPNRALKGNAHAYLSAPYGIYATSDGYLAMAMENLHYLAKALLIPEILPLTEDGFSNRDQIMAAIAGALIRQPTGHWLSIFEPADIWCAAVQNYGQFTTHPGYQAMHLEQTLRLPDGQQLTTTRCPVRIDGQVFTSNKPGPEVGADNFQLEQMLL